MTSQQVRDNLPVLIAFARGWPVECHNLSGGALTGPAWTPVDPQTGAFRLSEHSGYEFRVAESHLKLARKRAALALFGDGRPDDDEAAEAREALRAT